MRYTFGDAKRILAACGHAHSGADLAEKINNAVQALAGMNGWEFLRRLVRTFSASPVFALPQGTAGLVRACINGLPSSIHGTDYQFLHSGPGDLSKPPHGFRHLRSADIADVGFSPVLPHPAGPIRLAATSKYVTIEKPGVGYRPQPPVVVTGVTMSGERVTDTYEVGQATCGQPLDPSKFCGHQFSVIESVVLGSGTDEYITLHGMTPFARSEFVLGHYHPSVRVPSFHLFQVSSRFHGPYDVLAEVRIEPLPLIDDDDVVPLPSLEPIKHMMLYEYNIAINEISTAQQYQQMAVAWLAQMQVTDNTLQTPVVQNVLFEGSQGEISDEFENL